MNTNETSCAALNPGERTALKRYARARQARKSGLWVELRNRRLNGLKFVRQAPIGPYFVDFLCRKYRVVIEVDGATHSSDAELAYDQERSAYLNANGYREFRINNDDVYERMDFLLDGLLMFIGADEARD